MNPLNLAAHAPITLTTWAAVYLDSRTDLCDWTKYLHGLTLRRLAACFGSETPIGDQTHDDAAKFRRYVVNLGLAPASVAIEIRNAKTIYQRAVKRKLIPFNPFEEESGAAPEVAHDWPEIGEPEMERILSKCRRPGWRCLFALARWGGLRRGEAMRVRWADIDWEGHTLTVTVIERPDGRRIVGTKARKRTVPLCPRLYAVLLDAKATGGAGPCAELPRSVRNLARSVRAIARRAGFGGMRRPLHDLRRCRSSELFDRFPALTAAKWMGHSPAVAAKFYVRPTKEAVEAVTGGRESVSDSAPLALVLAKLEAIEARLAATA